MSRTHRKFARAAVPSTDPAAPERRTWLTASVAAGLTGLGLAAFPSCLPSAVLAPMLVSSKENQIGTCFATPILEIKQ
jgi:predicted cobalt transporter CbtA